MELTIENFLDFTIGLWEHWDLCPTDDFENAEREFNNAGYILLSSSEESKYFIHSYEKKTGIITEIVRISNHWGGGIGTCNWYLNGFEPMNSFSFKEKYDGEYFVGIIKLSHLSRIYFNGWHFRTNDDKF